MPRTKKSQTTETTITEVLDTPIEQTIEEAAATLGIDPFRLQELFVERLGSDDPMVWLTIPTEHEPLLAEIKRDLESEASVRRFDAPTEPATELPPVVEPPIIQEEAPIEQKSHTDPSGLTQTKTDAIDQNRQAATQTNQGISEALMLLQAQQGVMDSSQAATAYLTAFTANLANLKGEGLTVIAAQTLQEISKKSGFDPNEVLKQVGVPLSSETQEKLNKAMGQVLGNVQGAATQINNTTWGNGYDLGNELQNLEQLMNSKH
jgi:hypothetical protein